MPTVSVIIPTYNCESFILKSLASVRDQTFKDWEIIIVDDGSSDRTLELAEKSGIPCQIFRQAHQGPGAARNLGVSKSKGEWIAFLDADDRWLPEKLEKQLKAVAQMPKAGAVYTDVWLVDGTRPRELKSVHVGLPSGSIARDLLTDPRIVTTSTLLFKRSLWDKAGPFDVSSPIAEDWEWFLRLACHTDYCALREPLIEYQFHADNTHRNLDRNYPHARRMLELALKTYGAQVKPLEPAFKREIWHTFYQTYGIAYLFSWRSIRSTPFFIKAIGCQPAAKRNYACLAASFLPGRALKMIQRLRGRHE